MEHQHRGQLFQRHPPTDLNLKGRTKRQERCAFSENIVVEIRFVPDNIFTTFKDSQTFNDLKPIKMLLNKREQTSTEQEVTFCWKQELQKQ